MEQREKEKRKQKTERGFEVRMRHRDTQRQGRMEGVQKKKENRKGMDKKWERQIGPSWKWNRTVHQHGRKKEKEQMADARWPLMEIK